LFFDVRCKVRGSRRADQHIHEKEPTRANPCEQEDDRQDDNRAQGDRNSFGDTSTHRDFAGRSSKGYRRSDQYMREDARDRVAKHPDVEASKIEVNEGPTTRARNRVKVMRDDDAKPPLRTRATPRLQRTRAPS